MNIPRQHANWLTAQRADRLLEELVHDPYQKRAKLKSPCACAGCGAVYDRGRWTWNERPPLAHDATCPACMRIQDKVPAGFLTFSGTFVTGHRDEIDNLIHNVEAREKARHPLQRIMDLNDGAERVQVTFTDPHLARSVGEALRSAFQGELKYQYVKGEYLLRVTWQRDV